MKVYQCSGPAFDDATNGVIYYRTKSEAFASARNATSITHVAGQPLGSTATVDVCETGPVTHALVVALLNHQSWCTRSQKLAEFENGRVTTRWADDLVEETV